MKWNSAVVSSFGMSNVVNCKTYLSYWFEEIIDCSAHDSEIYFLSALAESALKWPLDCSGKTVFIRFLMSSSFSSHPILLVFQESSEVKCNSIRWLLPRGLWCSFSSCFSLSLPSTPIMQCWEVDHALLLLLCMHAEQQWAEECIWISGLHIVCCF